MREPSLRGRALSLAFSLLLATSLAVAGIGLGALPKTDDSANPSVTRNPVSSGPGSISDGTAGENVSVNQKVAYAFGGGSLAPGHVEKELGAEATSNSTGSTTTTASATVTIDSISFENENRDGPVRIHGGHPSDLDHAYMNYVEHFDGGSEDNYDLRVVDERGILIGVLTEDASEGDNSAIRLGMEEGGLFRRTGSHSVTVIVHHHNSDSTYTTSATVDVGLDADTTYGDVAVLPINPRLGETVTLDASHITQDSGETSIETYDWEVYEGDPDEGPVTLIKDVSGTQKISVTPSATGEHWFQLMDGSDSLVVDDGSFWVKSDPVMPSLSIDGLSVPSSALEGESLTATVSLDNNGNAQGNYIIRFKVDGTVVETEAYHADAGESDQTESTSFSLSEGTHDVTAVVIDSHNRKHTFSETVNVEGNDPPNTPSSPTPADGATGVSTSLTLGWSGGDPDSDDSVTYTVKLEKGDTTPSTTVASGLSNSDYTPSGLEKETTYSWQIVATDEHGESTTGPVWTFTTESETNQPPTADAGSDQTVSEGTSVELSAAGSSDPDGSITSYSWRQTAGTDVSLQDANSVTPTFTAPSVASTEELTFALTVSDGTDTDTDTVNVTVEPMTTDSASLTAEDAVASPGTEATVTFTLENTGESATGFILNVTQIPSGFSVVDQFSAGGSWKPSETKWLWQTVDAGQSVQPSVTLAVPSDAEGSYEVQATASTSDGPVATTTATVSTAVTIENAVDANDDGRIGDFEVLQAIEYWRTDAKVPDTGGRTIGDFKVLELVEMWRTNEEVSGQ